MSREAIQRFAFRVVSQTGIHYRKSSLSQSLGRPARQARRAAATASRGCGSSLQANGPVEDLFQKLDDTHFNLIVIGQPCPPEGALGLGDLLRIHADSRRSRQ